jgi:hypothetical protein
MDRFPYTYDHPNLNQEDNNHRTRSITQNELEAAIKSLPQKKSLGPQGFFAEFYKTFKEELIPTLLKLFQEIKREGKLPLCVKPVLHSSQNQTKTHPKKRTIGQSP